MLVLSDMRFVFAVLTKLDVRKREGGKKPERLKYTTGTAGLCAYCWQQPFRCGWSNNDPSLQKKGEESLRILYLTTSEFPRLGE
jgi:hypothetical protein